MGDLLFLEPRSTYDSMIIGVFYNFEGERSLAYDKDKIITKLKGQISSENKDISEEEALSMAIEYFDFNIAGSYLGNHTPVYISKEELTQIL